MEYRFLVIIYIYIIYSDRTLELWNGNVLGIEGKHIININSGFLLVVVEVHQICWCSFMVKFVNYHTLFVREVNKHTLLMLDLVLYMGSWVMIKIRYANPFEHVFHLTIVDMILYIYIDKLYIYIYLSLSPVTKAL